MYVALCVSGLSQISLITLILHAFIKIKILLTSYRSALYRLKISLNQSLLKTATVFVQPFRNKFTSYFKTNEPMPAS